MKRNRFKMLFILFIDLLIVLVSFLFANWTIDNFQIEQNHLLVTLQHMPLILPTYVISIIVFKLDKSLWRFASVDEAVKIVFSTGTSFFILLFVDWIFKLPIQSNVIVFANVIIMGLLSLVHFGLRILRTLLLSWTTRRDLKRTIIIGAGQASNLMIKEIRNNPNMKNKVVCLVDDDADKIGKFVLGIKIAGTIKDLPHLVSNYEIEEIIIAIPSANKSDIQRILRKCESLKVKIKILPPFYELMEDNFNVNKIRDVQIEDLLGRDPITIDTQGLSTFIEDEIVLVTGGGGSIGSELCRQISHYKPKKLIILDIYENNAYEIQNELLRHNDNQIDIITLIASVRDEKRIDEIFETYQPTIVFHAAAHKHVPLMEMSPKEAIKNNVFGTHNVVKASDKYQVKKFVLISTDKAVNPTNIMGATKRFTEMIIQAYDGISNTSYAAVRFGNVLGSNGSVIPLFKKQIEEGGPVTVTHKDIIRYFMTIPEAVQLVLQAGAFANGGEIFVLDMGEPVKILHLAEQLIRFSGFEPYKEIDIQITGLRPGEKLYEELLMDTEGLTKTENKKIFVLQQVESNINAILEMLKDLKQLVEVKDSNIQEEFATYVSTYHYAKASSVDKDVIEHDFHVEVEIPRVQIEK